MKPEGCDYPNCGCRGNRCRPAELDRIVDKVLTYKPKPRSAKAKKRARKRRKVQAR